jgi:ribosome maturation factor RimP
VTSVAERVREIVLPLAGALGLQIYDVEHAGGVLRIVVEAASADEPIGIDGIAALTRSVSRALDEADPITGHYTLEVTTPGLERTLRVPSHFIGAIGTEVKVKLVAGHEGDRRVAGELVAADDDGVTVRSADGVLHNVRHDEIERARTVFEWGSPPRDKKSPSRDKKVKA